MNEEVPEAAVNDGAPRKREKASEIADLQSPAGPSESSEPKKSPARRRRRSRSRSSGSSSAPRIQQAAPARSRESDADPAPQDPERSATTEPERSEGGGGSRRGRRPPRGRRQRPRPVAIDRVMLVHADSGSTQIAVLEEGEAVEFYVASEEDRSIAGNVYLGRVQNVLPGMEASFVDIGESRNGVLYAGEVGIAGDEGDEIPRIETVLKPGQSILVQVTKDPMRAKGARLTALVSLAGRHLVLVPEAESLGVSRRLSDGERQRLRDIAQEIRPQGHGLIVRTAAEGAGRADIERDLERLIELWGEIKAKAAKAKAPALVHEEPELELRVIRDLFNREIAKCIVDNEAIEATLRDYIRQTTPDLDHRLELYEGDLPIFEEFRILEQIKKSLDRRVWLPSGGHLVFDRTEAMTVVDVNTGKYVGKSNLEETVFRNNKEALVEVARQLRLRDIGGIIVIDFIDMEDSSNRDEIINLFRRELDRDRTRTQVFDITPLGLVQMTRKNVSAGIVETFSDPCSTCEGRGILAHDID